MVNKYLIPPGFKDSLNFDSYVEHQYKNTIVDYFKSNGFTLVKTPLIEYSKNLSENSISLKTAGKNEKISIRNDITPQIKRIASSRFINKKRPLKLCYYGEVVRKKGTMLRPERQFQQVGAEIIGTEDYKADVEIINLAYETLKKIGIKKIVIELSAPFIIKSILKNVTNKNSKNILKKYIKLKDLKNSLKLLTNKKQSFELKSLYQCSGQIKSKKKKILEISSTLDFKEDIKKLIKIAEKINISKNDSINIDLFELEDENYYQGVKFTFFAKNVRGEIAKGGRYLVSDNETAIGYTCFMDTIIRASSFENEDKKILIPFNTSKKIKSSLIQKGYSIFTSFNDEVSLKKQIKGFGFNYYLINNRIKKV